MSQVGGSVKTVSQYKVCKYSKRSRSRVHLGSVKQVNPYEVTKGGKRSESLKCSKCRRSSERK